MKINKIVKITLLLIAILLILIRVIFLFVNDEVVNVTKITPEENSQILASSKGVEIHISFLNNANKIIDRLSIKENFGLRWEKSVNGNRTVVFSAKFGNDIMAVEKLNMELFFDQKIIKKWTYEVPIDGKISGKPVEISPETASQGMPSKEDIEYFKEQDQINNEQQPLWKLLPYETDKYRISHYIDTLKLVVYLKEGINSSDVETEINEWIDKNGANSQEHVIEWRQTKSDEE